MRGKYATGQAEIDREIGALAEKYSAPATAELIRQMFTSVVKLHLDGADSYELRLLNTSLKELRHAFRVFRQYRGVPKVAVWGSARIKPASAEYRMAAEFSRLITRAGYLVITGGGGGAMAAGNCGAGGRSFAVNISLPHEQKPNPYVARCEKLISFKYFFDRKLIFVKESNATVLFPGGFGTCDEAFEMLTLYQTGKSVPRPIVLIEPRWGFWRGWLNFIRREMARRGFIAKHDLKLFTLVHSAKAAVKEILDFYSVYNSLRYVGPLTVLRLNQPLPAAKLKQLNKKFADLLTGGKIEAGGPTAEELKDKDLPDLPRLVMRFDRESYGRLNELIRAINGA
ncbi:MAG: TIGR00730 family Rossman fold protein [Candidatus Saganbacteria bacterium]|nr:TIGR00730 family Rossman fold protein [Candidatus Saganbacteria bacterium]